MCHHVEDITELGREEREAMLEDHDREELEAELDVEELEELGLAA